MITCTTVLHVKKGSEQPFEELLKKLVQNVRANEPGTSMFELARSQTSPRKYLVIEQYADADALARHSRSDYLGVTVPEMMALLEQAPELDSFDPVE